MLDLQSVAVRYDDVEGNLRVTWTYYNDIRINAPDGEMAREARSTQRLPCS